MIKEFVLTKSLAMIGCDHNQGVVKYIATFQFLEKHAELVVQVGKAIVVCVASHAQVMPRQR